MTTAANNTPLGNHQAGHPAAAGPQKILVVDDEQPMRILASSMIRKLGHESSTAASGEEAVAIYKTHFEEGNPFAIVVMDLALPGGMSGLEATIAIKQICPDASVVVSSGYLEQNARGAALEHGFTGILPKPYTAERLASELRWVLKHKEREAAAEAAEAAGEKGETGETGETEVTEETASAASAGTESPVQGG